MIHNKINLREDDPDIYMTTYLSELGGAPRDAMLILPGGGYEVMCAEHEGEPVALAYMNEGCNAFVLRYSIKEKATFPRPLCDVSLAVSYIRAHAKEFNINPNRIFVVGFSAGGHLAATLGVMWDLPEVRELTGIAYGENKPAGVILGYPLISGKQSALQIKGEFERHGIYSAIYRLHGRSDVTEEEIEKFSLENYVKPETAVPMFAFHTATDVLPVVHPLLLGIAYANAGLPFELHIFPNGPHGLSLGNRVTSLGNPMFEFKAYSTWLKHSIEWMKNL
jgi:acetyl esterase/lipase